MTCTLHSFCFDCKTFHNYTYTPPRHPTGTCVQNLWDAAESVRARIESVEKAVTNLADIVLYNHPTQDFEGNAHPEGTSTN